MQKSDTIALLAAALVKAQPMVEGAKKDSFNPGFKSRYADLESVWSAVRPALDAHKLAVTQFPDQTLDGKPALTTILIHESGEWISGTYPLISPKNDPQGFMSALTYGRRGGISSVMGVLAEDDDGNEAAKPAPKPVQAKPPAPAVPQRPSHEPAPSPAPKATITPLAWLDECLDRVPKMDRPSLDAFSDKQADRLARVRLLHPEKHAEVIKAIGDRYVILG